MADSTKRIAPLAHLSKDQNTALAAVLDALKGLPPEDAQEVLDHAAEHLAADDQPPMFARGIAGPLGKLICAVKTKIDDVTYGLWLQYCAARGLDTACVLRDCIYALVHGKTYRQMVMEKMNHEANRIDAMAQLIGPFGGPELMGNRKQ
ncbi:hypothetical protein QYQ99_22365 [Comamonas testosteroni]|uniref:hypothetical protein n=1 Tax=Comamonas testosteroni TaxID=285 RepID=UPI00265F5E88|nr:hypothetical protein [Comamonas testosteroni]WKL15077.1 hypothetical protein QYQ99_22365 [Comamonas testosteroni]